MNNNKGDELRILPIDEFGLLLFQINRLPLEEARPLETELREAYNQRLEKWCELEKLVKLIKNKQTSQTQNRKEVGGVEALIGALIDHSPVEFEKDILAGEPL